MDCVFPRLHVVTDTRPTADSPPLAVVRAVVAGALSVGATHELAVQVRVEDDVTDREAYALTVAVVGICRPAGVLCLVNDRLHIALAAGADGAHVGADDLPVAAARRVLDAGAGRVLDAQDSRVVSARADRVVDAGARPVLGGSGVQGAGAAWGAGGGSGVGLLRAVLGATCRSGEDATAAVAAGATYLGAGPAFTTGTKSGLPDPIGPNGIGAVARAVPGTPVLAIGGVTRQSAGMLRVSGAWGIAVVGAVSSARDPQRAAVELLRAVTSPPDAAAAAGPADGDCQAGGPAGAVQSSGDGATRVPTTGTGAGA